MSDTLQIGKKLVEFCSQGKYKEAIKQLYGPKIVSIEAQGNPQMPQRIEGFDAVMAKTDSFEQNHEIHSGKVEGPWPHGDRFVVRFTLDVTPKAGPMAGKRMSMDEVGFYTVKDGKITQEEFFYDMGG